MAGGRRYIWLAALIAIAATAAMARDSLYQPMQSDAQRITALERKVQRLETQMGLLNRRVAIVADGIPALEIPSSSFKRCPPGWVQGDGFYNRMSGGSMSTCTMIGGYVNASPDMSDGLDYPGADYDGFDLGDPDPAACRDLCRQQGDICRAWTFVKPGVQGRMARCYLKSSTPTPKPNGCCISGRALDPSGVRVEGPPRQIPPPPHEPPH